MNKQEKRKNGVVVGRGIEWTSYTHNPIQGCLHGCEWVMPDQSMANCYAEDVADNVAQAAYPHGFEHHYWNPDKLDEPLRLKKPSKIFLGSMADNLGHWVPDEQVQALIQMCQDAHWHTFQWLTKNPVRARNFNWPSNVWLGASTPPDKMWGKSLSHDQQERMLIRTLKALSDVDVPVRWLSAEPLSWDISDILDENPSIQWIVIGAASNGKKFYPPVEAHVRRLIDVCDFHGIKVFFKGNLKSLAWARGNWREDFPEVTR